MPVTANEYRPFDAGAGSAVVEAGWRAMAKHWLQTGPLITGSTIPLTDSLQPSAGAGLQVLVDPGEAWIQGHHGKWNGTSALTVAANASGSVRVDAIVARADFVGNDIELDLVAGTPGAGLPALTTSSSVWEVLLGSSTLASGGSSVTVVDLRKLVGRFGWGAFTPACRFGAATTNVTSSGRYRFTEDRDIEFEVEFAVGSGATPAGQFGFDLPYSTYHPRVAVGTAYVHYSGSGSRAFLALHDTGSPGDEVFLGNGEFGTLNLPPMTDAVPASIPDSSFGVIRGTYRAML